MSSVALITTKGGSGKSTIATHLAIAAAGQKRRVLVLDCDTAQSSIQVWASVLREAPKPVVRAGTYETIEQQLDGAPAGGFDLVIVDVPPSGGALVTLIASLVDHILIPVRATTFDLHAVRHTVELLRKTVDDSRPACLAARNALGKAAVVLNSVPSQISAKTRADIEGALISCKAGDLEIIASISDRAAFSSSIAKGQGVTEWRGDARARDEMLDLYRGLNAREKRKLKAARMQRGAV